MIAQLQAAPAVPSVPGLGQPSPKGAAEGFAALMQGMAGQEAAPEPQVQGMQTPLPETDTAEDALPDYRLEEEAGDLIRVTRRRAAGAGQGPVVSDEARDALKARAAGWDVYALEAEWRAWWEDSGRPRLGNADRAFLAWADKRVSRG